MHIQACQLLSHYRCFHARKYPGAHLNFARTKKTFARLCLKMDTRLWRLRPCLFHLLRVLPFVCPSTMTARARTTVPLTKNVLTDKICLDAHITSYREFIDHRIKIGRANRKSIHDCESNRWFTGFVSECRYCAIVRSGSALLRSALMNDAVSDAVTGFSFAYCCCNDIMSFNSRGGTGSSRSYISHTLVLVTFA